MMPDGRWLKCGMCLTDMWLPAALYEAAKNAGGAISFYCPYGHQRVFNKGESREDALRRERDRLAQQIAQRDDQIATERRLREAAEATAEKERKASVRLKKRAATGTCPCCNRNFSELQKHIATKHPTFRAEDAGHENIVSLVKART